MKVGMNAYIFKVFIKSVESRISGGIELQGYI